MAEISNYSYVKVTLSAPDPLNAGMMKEIWKQEGIKLPESHIVKCKWCGGKYIPRRDISICPTCGGPYG